MAAVLLKIGGRAALCAALGVVAGAGCASVPLRADGSPVEEKCPEGARKAMASFGLRKGLAGIVEVGATQQSRDILTPLIVYDGPIESVTWSPIVKLPAETRLQGRVWTRGPRVVIRYYSARLPDGKVIPFCGVAAENGHGLPGSPGHPGTAAIKDTTAWVYFVERFR